MDKSSLLEPFIYPETLYCDVCRRDVTVNVIDQTASFDHSGGRFTVRYKAAACPGCGKILCDRDQDRAIMTETLKIMEEENARHD